MRRNALLLIFLFCCTMFASAGKRNWQEAEVLDIKSVQEDVGAVRLPLGTSTVYAPVRHVYVYYTIATADVVYVLALVNKKPLNVTLHGKTRIALDGDKARILDDAGKEVKIAIIRKTARAHQRE